MDAATSKQKTYIKGLFVQGGLPDCIFSPLHRWKIDYRRWDINMVLPEKNKEIYNLAFQTYKDLNRTIFKINQSGWVI